MSEVETVEVDGLECRIIKFYGQKLTFYKVNGVWHRSTKSVRRVEAALNDKDNDKLPANVRKTLSRKKHGPKLKHKKTTKDIVLGILQTAIKAMTDAEIASNTSLAVRTIYHARRVLCGEGKIRIAGARLSEATSRKSRTWELVA